MMRRAGSIVANYYDLDFLVLRYVCHDSSVRKSLGLNVKECEWKVQCRDSPPLDIKLHVDKTILHKTQVQVSCNNEIIFPQGYSSKCRLFEDFKHTWPFRGIARGIGETHYVEMKLWHNGTETWFLATALKQRKDGFFEVLATKPDALSGRITEEFYPAVSKRDLREAATKQPFEAPERTLVLMVPKLDPLQGATLRVDGGEFVTHYFGRPTPQSGSGFKKPVLQLQVTKDRRKVTANVGHMALMNTLKGEARAVQVIPTRPGKLVGCGSKLWTIQIGQAEHKIQIERRWKACKVVTLSVDGEILVEAAGEDLGCDHGMWECSFRFVGEPTLEFEVYETNPDGYPLDSKGSVLQRRSFTRHCVVTIPNLSDLSAATLVVDNVHFRDLPPRMDVRNDGLVEMTPQAMSTQYGIVVPFKVNRTAPTAMNNVAQFFNISTGQNGYPMGPNGQPGVPGQPWGSGYRPNNSINNGGGLFAMCGCCPPEEEIQLVGRRTSLTSMAGIELQY
mmetsp:Transcript_118711/g.221899  ORF Transcript_118711/g.221899 Transcript_118711/m.221899 type:complete len:505 (+) Transcript_118711:59-1573(+)